VLPFWGSEAQAAGQAAHTALEEGRLLSSAHPHLTPIIIAKPPTPNPISIAQRHDEARDPHKHRFPHFTTSPPTYRRIWIRIFVARRLLEERWCMRGSVIAVDCVFRAPRHDHLLTPPAARPQRSRLRSSHRELVLAPA
jgi:hypothetical protein